MKFVQKVFLKGDLFFGNYGMFFFSTKNVKSLSKKSILSNIRVLEEYIAKLRVKIENDDKKRVSGDVVNRIFLFL